MIQKLIPSSRALLGVFLLAASGAAHAVNLSDYPNYEYDLRFSNPECVDYAYDETVYSVDGTLLKQKPKNVYCKYSDSGPSGARPDSVQSKLVEWIRDPSTREIFFAYLSFSNSRIRDELCRAVETRGLKITFVLDQTTEFEKANTLTQCQPPAGSGSHAPKLVVRGHEGGIGFAHNKIFIVNPNSKVMKLVFSSGNMSSGVTLHHENWHFITVDSRAYFAQAHLCLMNGVLEHASSVNEYARYISRCRQAIETKEEDDIKTFFVPGEGDQATDAMAKGARDASKIYIAAHRFSYSRMLRILESKLKYDQAEVRLVLDDDLYWVAETGEEVGPNQAWEFENVRRLTRLGASVRYMETNHTDHLLHHNKFLVFVNSNPARSSVFTGAGNLTGTAFESNFENFYWIKIPSVVDRFIKQYRRMWDEMATAPEKMPETNVLP